MDAAEQWLDVPQVSHLSLLKYKESNKYMQNEDWMQKKTNPKHSYSHWVVGGGVRCSDKIVTKS